MTLRFNRGSKRYEKIWNHLLDNGETGNLESNTDEQWMECNSSPPLFYVWYRTPDETLVKAVYEVDAQAEMDSDEFTDWSSPEYILVMTGTDDDES